MVEVNVLLVPLNGEVLLVRVDQSLIDWLEVLHSSLGRDESVSGLKSWFVTLKDGEWIPGSLALWVKSCGNVEISIDLCQDFGVDLIEFGVQLAQEDDLKVAVPSGIVSEVIWGGITSQVDV